MGDCMTFNDNPMDFIKDYSFKDTEEIYTNGSELVPVFRVEQMMDYYMPRWIPVTERLPKYDTPVLVQASGKPQSNITFENAYEFASFSKEEGWILEHYPGWKDPNVIAWMPLPEPYKKPYPECMSKFMDRFMKVN